MADLAAGSRKTARSAPATPEPLRAARVWPSPTVPTHGTAPDGPDRDSELWVASRRSVRSGYLRVELPAGCPACRYPACLRGRRTVRCACPLRDAPHLPA